ncbi:MAG TPA: UDP-N-acetylmuramoyl-L-alanyl-D-glutamate--2,6-diaminopimelate ligase [Rhabdochlamydiaceae bacterium]|nr:UDP-N-acetylmuramoyl-L-alanyl-D-glutamate--2,6-diaminopimelate ligase [Rhabdochlamydiaceae bacterium]
MKLKRLLKNFPELCVKGSKEIEITGICCHSKMSAPGNLFVAKKGTNLDGTKFIHEAVHAGAIAVLTDLYDPFLDVVQIIATDVAQMEAQLAAEYYQFPSKELTLIGITGTSGKTTCGYLIRELLEKTGTKTGLIGTVEWIVGKNHLTPTLTTPDVITNQKLLREMCHHGSRAAVMEVSSHALDQNRVIEIDFQRALFTNLSHDHLDYHKTMESYARAKQKLFQSLKEESFAIFNADDPMSGFMAESCKAKKITYGLNPSADLFATNIQLSANSMQFDVHAEGKILHMKSNLIGKFNVYNLLAVIALGLSFSIPLETCIASLSAFKGAPGRMQKIKNSLGLNIFVDYAHKGDALQNVLTTLQEIKRGKIITVFGCGGNRDRGKRKKMGHIAQEFSDIVIVTSDNPRSEDPQEIVREICEGISLNENIILELDRKEAIRKAIEIGAPKDLILIAGKGHETYQIFAHQTIDFDDGKIAQQICDEI